MPQNTALEPRKNTDVPIILRTLDDVDVKGKTVLVRVDLNVPMVKGKVSDLTRITSLLPTLHELADKKARVVLLSHFDRPNGKFVPSMSLAPLVDVLERELNRDSAGSKHTKYTVKFGVDAVGKAAREAVDAVQPGEILLLENIRFHAGEEANDPAFAKALASLGDIFVNDAFSVSHRAHASVTGIADYLPAYAGRLLEREVDAFDKLLHNPRRPLAAVVGGAKISTKLEILEHLTTQVDYLVIGGAMANTFLKAQGYAIGKSLYEPDLVPTAKRILDTAGGFGCEVVLPLDVVVAQEFAPSPHCRIVRIDTIPEGWMQLDVGPETVHQLSKLFIECESVVWNGPLGAFETKPFDASTVACARMVCGRTRLGKMFSLAGGGDTVAALAHAGLTEEFSYLSTAGGAFLEWLQGTLLPGVKVLLKDAA